MAAPDYLPILSKGAHDSPAAGACVMEYVSLLAGEPWSDSPTCTHPVLAAAARNINDQLADAERHRLVPLIGRLFDTAPTGTDHQRKVLSVLLAAWSAQQVLPRVREQDRQVCQTVIDTAEKWCDGLATEDECRTAAAANVTCDKAAYANAAANSAANAAASNNTNAAAAATAYYVTAAVAAYYVDAADALVDFLTGLLDEYDRLTGRTNTMQLDTTSLARLASAVGR